MTYTIHHYTKEPWYNTERPCVIVEDIDIVSDDILWLIDRCETFARRFLEEHKSNLQEHEIVIRPNGPYTAEQLFVSHYPGAEICKLGADEYKHAWIVVPRIQ